MNGPDLFNNVKKNVLGLYLKALDQLDPQVATHILQSNKEFFLAGQRFFESEVQHAEKAINKMQKKRGPASEPEAPSIEIAES